MDLSAILRKLVEHSTLNGADKAELTGHIDALTEPAGTPAEQPATTDDTAGA